MGWRPPRHTQGQSQSLWNPVGMDTERERGAEADQGRSLARREPCRRRGWGKHNVWEALEETPGHKCQGISKPRAGDQRGLGVEEIPR